MQFLELLDGQRPVRQAKTVLLPMVTQITALDPTVEQLILVEVMWIIIRAISHPVIASERLFAS